MKDDIREKPSIDLTLVVQYGRAERVTQGPPGRFAFLYNFSSNDVGVNDRPPEEREALCHRRLPGPYPARQSDSFHTSTLLMARDIPASAGAL